MTVKDNEQKLAEYAIEQQNKRFKLIIDKRIESNPSTRNYPRLTNATRIQLVSEWFTLWRRN